MSAGAMLAARPRCRAWSIHNSALLVVAYLWLPCSCCHFLPCSRPHVLTQVLPYSIACHTFSCDANAASCC